MVILNRKVFLASSAAAAAASSVAQAQNIPGGTHRVERRADFDEQAFATTLGRPAQIRQLYETVTFEPGVLNSIKNSFNGLQFGFGYPADRDRDSACRARSFGGLRLQRLHLEKIPHRRIL